MKHLILAALSLAGAFAAPSRLHAREISTELFDTLTLFAQYAAAAQCNNHNSDGQAINCVKGDVCPLVEAANTTTTLSFATETTDTNGYIAVDHTRSLIVLVFRGTESGDNVWIDLHIALKDCPLNLTPGCKIHEGFRDSWLEVSSTIFAGIEAAKARNPGYKLVITGHSLGGAVGTLAAAYLRAAGHPADLYTYGSPRVGNLAFVKFVTEQAGDEYRVTNWRDIVPTIPTMTGIFEYRHTSPEYWVGTEDYKNATNKDIQVCPGYDARDCNEKGFPGAEHHVWYLGPITGCSAKNLES